MEKNTWENETAPARKKSKAPWIIAIVVALLAAAAAILIPRLMEQRRLERYDQGTEFLSQKNYEQAREVFLALGDYNCLAVITGQTYNADGVQFEYTQSRHQPDYFCFEDTAMRRKK